MKKNICIKEYCIKNRLITVFILLFLQTFTVWGNDRYEILQLTEVKINSELIINFFRDNVFSVIEENGYVKKNVYIIAKFKSEDTINIFMLPDSPESYPIPSSDNNHKLYVTFIDGYRVFVETDRMCKLITSTKNLVRYKFLRTFLIVNDNEYYWCLSLKNNEAILQYFQHLSDIYIRESPNSAAEGD